MLTKTYKARTLAEAIEKIRAEMGASATIVSTHKVPARKGLFRDEPARLEVTAQVDDTKLSQRQIERIHGGLTSPGSKSLKNAALTPDKGRALNMFKPLAKNEITKSENLFKSQIDIEKLVLPSVMQSEDDKKLQQENEFLKNQIEAMKQSLSQLKTENQNFVRKYSRSQDDLDEIRLGIKSLLVDKGVGQNLIDNWVEHSLAEVKSEDFDVILDDCADYLMSRIRVYGANLPRVMSFSGPAGSGKTLTVKKLAKLLEKKGKRILIVSMDRDVGNVEQYRLFSLESLISVNFVTVNLSLRKIITEAREVDHILIDTCSYPYTNHAALFNMQRELNAVGCVNYLVYSASDIDTRKFTNAFGELEFSGTIFTRLDETNSPGPVLNQCYNSSLPILYFGIGKNLDEDLEKASPERILAMVMDVEEDRNPKTEKWKPKTFDGDVVRN